MHYLSGEEEKMALSYIKEAGEIALDATCTRSKCGTVIVKNGIIIGTGFNSPSGNLESGRRCACSKAELDSKITDKTCCMHAEQRAIMDALKNHPDDIHGSRLYFVRLGEDGKAKLSGQPYCTICSKMSLDVGISEFVLHHEQGVCIYGTEEYNALSYNYNE